MIKRLKLRNFKGFEKFELMARHQLVVLGPNSAGKSTLLEALRCTAHMLGYAMKRSPSELVGEVGEQHRAYPIDADQFELEDENLRHEFRDLETSIDVQFSNSASLRAVWPPDGDHAPWFRLVDSDGLQPSKPSEVRRSFPTIGVVPMLSPLERREIVLDSRYLRQQVGSRLASRHFRNQLLLMKWESQTSHALDNFLYFCEQWLPEIRLEPPEQQGKEIDVYFREGKVPKELNWAGDGVQVFLQLLFHLWRLRGSSTIILDEPDVYLHADLQRRLIRLLETMKCQFIVATHSAEIAAEASADSLTWVDKGRSRSVRVPNGVLLGQLSTALGTGFNLALARTLRASVALFVEGDDMVVLREIAQTLGCERLARETGVAVVPIQGASNRTRLEGFAWLAHDLLSDAVKGFLLLDRDYHSLEAVASIKEQIRGYGIHCHIWKYRELESYLLNAGAIARLSSARRSWVESVLDEEASAMKYAVQAAFVAQRYEDREERKYGVGTTTESAMPEFDEIWSSPLNRIPFCPPKDLLSAVNRRLQEEGKKAVSIRALARALKPDEVPDEMAEVLWQIEGLVAAPWEPRNG